MDYGNVSSSIAETDDWGGVSGPVIAVIDLGNCHLVAGRPPDDAPCISSAARSGLAPLGGVVTQRKINVRSGQKTP